MEFSVMTSSHLQPNMMTCGTQGGDLYVLDAFHPDHNRITKRSLRKRAPQRLSSAQGSQPETNEATAASGRPAYHNANKLIVGRFNGLFKSGIVCVEHHPRLPSIIAVGLVDGSVHLLFLEIENLQIKQTAYLCRFSGSVDQLEWLLVDDVGDMVNRKTRSTSFTERIWKSIARASYNSLLVGRAGSQVKVVRVERNFHVFNFFKNIVAATHQEKGDVNHDIKKDFRGEGADQEGDTPPDPSPKHVQVEQTDVVLITTIKWPLASYFEEDPEYPTLTNFCLIKEALCIFQHRPEGTLMQIYTPVVDASRIVFVRFGKSILVRVRGVPSAVSISPKQYNQMNRHLATSNPHFFTLNGEKCLNALGEFIAIGSDEGYVYTTTLLHIYNEAHSAVRRRPDDHKVAMEPKVSPLNMEGCHTDAESTPETSQRNFHTTSPTRSGDSAGTDCVAIEMASCFVGSAVLALHWGLIWNDYTAAPGMLAPAECCCTDDITFLLTARTGDHVDVLRLSKCASVLRAKPHRRIETRCSAAHWVEDIMPNDMTLMMATRRGVERITWDRVAVQG
ncbi:LamB/YcsF family protein [Babesia caballi]|uniref:LamB/YcsF family protein n=1 Tax=Babesia caballi TaxID=5871 RepID=A0AAV4M0I4_BABCB|nr:LamB/YcsF family protein [Babesia caballi]